ncbi:MAG: flavodoxin family protein [Erysipelotrichaceae bacterium]|nr:flavodoxin family protein [Erysipelotrichaceae bacterium]
MKLVIHDLNDEQWQSIADEFPDAAVISDNGKIRPCIGCFGCWNRDPGRCVDKDGYENMGELYHKADETIFISRLSYGGFSGFVKNICDRSLGYVLPHFEIVNGESHHQKRYDEDKPFTFIFYGHNMAQKEKDDAVRYVHAVCTNMRTHVKEVIFREFYEDTEVKTSGEIKDGRTVILNSSMRCVKGNTAKLCEKLKGQLKTECEIINLASYLNKMDELVENLKDVSTLVLAQPLYVDGLPSQTIRLLERFERNYDGPSKRVYALSNMGLYEPKQLVNMFAAVENWCIRMHFEYCGALGVAAGELVGALMEAGSFRVWPLSRIYNGINELAKAIDEKKKTADIYTGVNGFPRSLYVAIANSGWKRMGKKNGITNEDLFRRL